jgi:hypothetical protein
MKRLSRHTVVALSVLLLSSVGGMSVAVVAFGQSGGADPDATVPLGDYTGTTPAPSTAPLSGYTTTTPTVQTQPVTPASTTPTETGESSPTTTSGTKPSRTHGSATVPNGGGGTVPSRATRSGPTHLAFTGGEPIVIGAFGVMLIAAGFLLHARRRRGVRQI